jgi:hypothetical protein
MMSAAVRSITWGAKSLNRIEIAAQIREKFDAAPRIAPCLKGKINRALNQSHAARQHVRRRRGIFLGRILRLTGFGRLIRSYDLGRSRDFVLFGSPCRPTTRLYLEPRLRVFFNGGLDTPIGSRQPLKRPRLQIRR